MKNLKKNYFLLLTIFIVTLLITLYINSIIRDYKYIKVDVSPLQDSISQINLNELDIALSELNNLALEDAHATYIVTGGDRDALKKLKINLTCESEYIENIK